MKVFDAIEGVEGVKPRLILVSSLDIRDPEKIPAHYVSILIPSPRNFGLILLLIPKNEDDIFHSTRIRKVIPVYMHWKYEADKNLAKRTAFKWTILRPGGLSDKPGVGKADVGRTHLGKMISVRALLFFYRRKVIHESIYSEKT